MKEQLLPTGIKCPECGEGQLHSFTQTEEFDFDLGDEIVKVRADNVSVKKCDKCGEGMSGPEAAKVRHEAVCRAAGLLAPFEIKAIRDKFGWSQQYLATLTRYGVATVSRWERGRLLQNRSADMTLRAILDCPPFREYLELKVSGPRGDVEPARPIPVNRIKPRYSSPEERVTFADNAKKFDLSRN